MAYDQLARADRVKMYAAAGLLLALAFVVVDYAVFTGALASPDAGLFKLINEGNRPPALDDAMVLLTDYGRELVWGAATVGLLIFGYGRKRRLGVLILVLIAVLAPLGTAVKDLQSRDRPYDVVQGARLIVAPESDSSFPSGHTLIVSGGAVLALIYLRKELSVPLTVEASLVSLSRIYVGVHYPTDVLAGALLGASIAFLLASQSWVVDAVYDRAAARIRKPKPMLA